MERKSIIQRAGQRLIEAMGGISESQYRAHGARMHEAGFLDGNSGNDDPASGDIAAGGFGFRRARMQDLREGKLDPLEVMEVVWNLYQSSPIAKRVLRIKRGYMVGNGVSPVTEDEALQEILDAYWEKMKLDKNRGKEFPEQLFLFGEQYYPAFVRESDGRVLTGYIDPLNVKTVIHHPQMPLEPWAVVVWRDANKIDVDVYRIIREEEPVLVHNTDSEGIPFSQIVEGPHVGKLVTWQQAILQEWETGMLHGQDVGEYAGSTFFTKVNSVSNMARGYSDLMQVADWIDQADQTLFAVANREQYAGFFSWDVTLVGASPEEVSARATSVRASPPKKGSMKFHNDQEIWELKTPDLKQAASIGTLEALLTFIMGGMGMPLAWYGFGTDTNRSTLESQSAPTWRQMEDDQAVVRDMYASLCEFVRDQAEIAGTWAPTEGVDHTITFNMPEMTLKDLSSIVAVLPQLAMALSELRAGGLMSDEIAAKLVAKMVEELGLEVNAMEELDSLSSEDQEIANEALARFDEYFAEMGVNGD